MDLSQVAFKQEDDIMRIEIEKEDDGRWIADVCDLPGAMFYGMTRQEALVKAKVWRFVSSQIESIMGNLFQNWMSCLGLFTPSG